MNFTLIANNMQNASNTPLFILMALAVILLFIINMSWLINIVTSIKNRKIKVGSLYRVRNSDYFGNGIVTVESIAVESAYVRDIAAEKLGDYHRDWVRKSRLVPVRDIEKKGGGKRVRRMPKGFRAAVYLAMTIVLYHVVFHIDDITSFLVHTFILTK